MVYRVLFCQPKPTVCLDTAQTASLSAGLGPFFQFEAPPPPPPSARDKERRVTVVLCGQNENTALEDSQTLRTEAIGAGPAAQD
ncbi:hypothetical protein PAMP_016247 [Pampus punctatissimus]